MRSMLVTCLCLLLPVSIQASEPDPLFRADDVLQVTLRAPLVRIMEERESEKEEPGSFVYTSADGTPTELTVKVSARGNFRRNPDVCRFAPLRLNFVKSETKNTLFHKQDKLKLVTHCERRSAKQQRSVLREYLAYRVLNLLTDTSFRVRLLEITYEDTAANRRPYTEYGFLIEHKNRLGKRIDAEPFDIGRTSVSRLEPDYLALTSIFEFFIANTDFSPIASQDPDSCCHNHALFGKNRERYFSIPYDFDMSGFVNATYAKPNPRFGIRTVTARLYRGRCSTNDRVPAALDLFRKRRDSINELVSDFEQLDSRSRKQLGKFIDYFYKIINDPKDLQKRIYDDCI